MAPKEPIGKDQSALIRLRVTPRGGSDRVEGWRNGVLRVRVSAAPDKGKANKAVIGLLADDWGLPRSALEIVSGAASRDKTVAVRPGADPGPWLEGLRARYPADG